jgi:hypothetical protein
MTFIGAAKTYLIGLVINKVSGSKQKKRFVVFEVLGIPIHFCI